MKAKKIVAIITAATMVLGCGITALADASTTGQGTQTGHLEKKMTNVVLPTVNSSNNTYFNFVVDPERLITAANNKYKGGAVTLTTTGGVYFLQSAANTYDGTSQAYEVVNKSSHAVNISANATASVTPTTASMIKLVAKDDVDSDTSVPQLYLGIKVGSGSVTAITDSTNGVSASAEVAGAPDNFEIISNTDGSFSYQQKSTADASTWQKTTIQLEGLCNQVENAGSAVAPTIDVTWSYSDAGTLEAYCGNKKTEAAFWVAPTENTTFTAAPTSVKINGNDATYQYTKNWVKITNPKNASTYEIEIVSDGKTYKVTL